MKLLVTGSEGQLGRALRPILEPRHEVLWGDLPDLDVGDLAALRDLVRGQRPDAILHLAALTQVDACEEAPEAAFRVNSLGTRFVAIAAREVAARLLFISTDYVFDGRQARPYREYDTPQPLNVYGWSKLHGERIVQALVPEHCIVRTSGLFGPGGRNFVAAILSAYGDQGRVAVVTDQICRPTYVGDLAAALAVLLEGAQLGTYHVASAGPVSWFDFAQAVLTAAGQGTAGLRPISSAELGRPATRPARSVLDTHAYEAVAGRPLPHWRSGLAAYLSTLPAGA